MATFPNLNDLYFEQNISFSCIYIFFFFLLISLFIYLFIYSVGNFLMSSALFEEDPSPFLRRNLSYLDDQDSLRKFTASPASYVGLHGNFKTAFWHWDLPLTSVVIMTEKLKSTFHPSSLQNLLIGRRIFGQIFFFFFFLSSSCWDSWDPSWKR